MRRLSPEIWYEALASQCGVWVKTDDPTYTKQKLYAIRKNLQDPDLGGLTIYTSPRGPNEIWLVKGGLTTMEHSLAQERGL